jgi:16S rRNA (guanine527-N7)-methyltransferase
VNSRDFQGRLHRRARKAGVSLGPDLAAGLAVYFRLLATWNEKVNLAGLDLRDPTPDAIDRLLVEPLVAARHAAIGALRVIDIGSGGGSPAIPIALALRESRVAMVESKTRKSVFLREALRVLKLEHSEVLTARFEELLARPELHERHDLLTIRAVRIDSRVLMNVQAFVKPGGQLFLFRGTDRLTQPDAVTPPLAWSATYPLMESLRSRLVVLEKRSIGRENLSS